MLTFLLRILGFLPKKVNLPIEPTTPADRIAPNMPESVTVEVVVPAKVPAKRVRKPRQPGQRPHKKTKI